MGAADFGVLLLSAWLDGFLQPRHCLIKDWRYSPVVKVCYFIQWLILQRGMSVMRGEGDGDLLRGRRRALSSCC